MREYNFPKFFVLGSALILLNSCGNRTDQTTHTAVYPVNTRLEAPAWTKNAVIYEVNIRQHTEEGTFNAFTEHLPRLKEMGVDILWLMPVFPIGSEFRKVSQTKLVEELEDPNEAEKYLGSYYSIRDYRTVNPEFGTEEDFHRLVEKAHSMGMYVILDIAANHTSWDHAWINEHPDYYLQVDTANPPWRKDWMEEHPDYFKRLRELGMTYPIDPDETDWWDTAELDYDNPELRREMTEILTYWVKNYNIDGYRADVAGRIPCDFWDTAKAALDDVKDVFMLAEDEAQVCLLREAFHMNYAWELHHIMNDVAAGEKTAQDLYTYYQKQDTLYDPDIYRMNFITNHDENSWNGTVAERMGEASDVFAMLTFTLPGMPLLYSGQEIGLDKRLKFFERDPIQWHESPLESFYTQLISIKKSNPALWNGGYGGTFEPVYFENYKDEVFAFQRLTDENEVLVIANLSGEAVELPLNNIMQKQGWIDALTGNRVESDRKVTLEPYRYLIWVRNPGQQE